MFWLKFVTYLDIAVVVFLTSAYFYQNIYLLIGFLRRHAKPETEPEKLSRFAVLISARNERNVIGELIGSLKKQNYPSDLVDIYVLADNCTDDTASVAEKAGARVFERHDSRHIGKGYALNCLVGRISDLKGLRYYDGYFVFDADNIVDPNFVREMNKTFSRGFDAVTCYRNSKNFGSNWISASYSIAFLREARYMNYPRMLLGNNCAVSGTGFLVSSRLMCENNGWPFHLLTEDIQFSVNCAISGRRIGYCDRAMVYDEQPITFSQSWKQRLRWSKGFFQVCKNYLASLAKNSFTRKGYRASCYDMFMTVAPCSFLTLAVLLINAILIVAFFTQPYIIALIIVYRARRYLVIALINYYIGSLFCGALTVATEWKRIQATTWQKLKYLPLYPVFVFTYLPITLVALLKKVQWSPIEHYSSKQLDMAGRRA